MRIECADHDQRTAMVRTLKRFLCVILWPLTAACQGKQAPPPGTTVKLVALEPISSATLKPGMIVQFRVWRDVVVNGSTVITAGTGIEATVRSVQRASREHHRDGKVRLTLQEIDSSGYHIKLTMNDDFAPMNIKHRRASKIKGVAETAAAGAILIALAPISFPWVIGMSGSSTKPTGDELGLKPCFHADVYIRSAQTLSKNQGPSATPRATNDLPVCAGSTESMQYDGSFLYAVADKRLGID
jgi:hypothetical protein